MSMETAALLGMGAVLVFGLAALGLAFVVHEDKKTDRTGQRHV